jgi:hypothetical protein
MEANELMIGDFVLDGNIYAQVTSITCDGNIETTHNKHSDIELIEPIPLTPEILKKNGWEERPKGYVFYKKLCKNTFVVNAADIQIKYVHELQHALRLCEIEKEIIL